MRRPRPHSNPRPEPAAGPPVELDVEAMGAQGDGVAAGGALVAFTLPGERVAARLAAGGGEGARGDLVEVLRASPERTEPPCPHFGRCGGCALQHWDHAPYLAWKVEQVRRALGRERIETDILAPWAAPPGARRRLALHARRGSRPGEAALGFKARRSWSLTPIEVCPISEPALVAALPALRRLAAPFLEHAKSAPTLHVTLTETGLDVDVTGVEQRSGGLSADARVRVAALAAEADLARVTLSGETLYGAREAVVRFGRARVALPPGSFLQAVAAAEAAMAEFAVAALDGAPRAADLYCGAGAFTYRLAEVATVHAADQSAPAVRALSAGLATAPGLKTVRAEARDLARRPVLSTELDRVEALVFDPPRAGAPEQAVQIAGSRTPQVAVGVSCNAQTFARDAAVLAGGGWRLLRVLPVDQFLWSPHIELVGVFTR